MILLPSTNTYRHTSLIKLVTSELGHHYTDSSTCNPTSTTIISLRTHKWAKEVIIADDSMG